MRQENDMTYAGTTGELTAAPGTTQRLLGGGAAAAPLFILSALAQAATRPGYDLTRHPISVLSNGNLGWVQISTFLVTGALTLGYAVAARRILRGGPAGTWGPILLAVQGAGLVVAGAFRMDPVDGFPPGTPAGTPTSMSWHAMVHNAAGSLTFLSMIALCFVLARRFTATAYHGWAVYGRICGLVFAAGLIWAITGGRDGALTLFIGVIAAWTWIATSAARLTRPATRKT
jgi:Protein of unknown function (DUF998)